MKKALIALFILASLSIPADAAWRWRKQCALGIFCSWHHVHVHKPKMHHYRPQRTRVIKKVIVKKEIVEVKKDPKESVPKPPTPAPELSPIR